MAQSISLTVDGRPHTVDVEPDMPLLYALRNDLNMDTPHFGCGLSQCGACTVLVDGKPVRSCQLPVSRVAGHQIMTVAGLGTADKPHPVQTAWIEEQAFQCGYCMSGWMLTAAALLNTNKNPTDAEIRQAMAGLKCRCGTHMAMLRAVKRAAKAMG